MKITVLLLILPFISFSQVKYLNGYPNFGIPIENNEVYYFKYPSKFRISKKCKSYNNCNNIYPEETLISVLSANNFEWDKKNYNYEIKNNKVKYSKKEKFKDVYFELLRKLSFNWNESDYSVIKYHIIEENRKINSCSVMKRIEDKWYIIKPTGSLSKIFVMFNYLSSNALDAIIENKKLGVEKFDKQIDKIYSSGILNLSKAINSTTSSEMSDSDLKKILDPLMKF